jgi:hypothetical protein
MPIPAKESGETEEKYIGRCMSAISDEYPQEQALAICYGKFRENMNTESKIASKLSQIKKYEGLNLKAVYAEGLEDACWEGYEAIGTKVLDGKIVPNCVPIEE